ncbi:ATP12 family chaperone protein [Hyphococcus luteus]|uniref:ATP12 family chaperone protein n=1 Tax=Hyphococcus luteus TaxID=2058213 RepID=UPI0013FE14F1|nr:ATP12 family protein [Marinicaulis flavus]
MSENVRPKRFYKEVAVVEHEGRHGVALDGRKTKTRGRNVLAAPTPALAEAVAAEWDLQGEHIDRTTMPLTAMLSAAIDGGEEDLQAWREEIVKYLGSDLVCYRADAPAVLAERQAAIWDPYIEFMRREFGAILVTTAGIVAVPQADASFSAVRGALAKETPETLFGLQIAAAIAGSAVLALALWKGEETAESVFEASRVDERFQEEKWGVDEEAKARENRLRADFLKAAEFLALLDS